MLLNFQLVVKYTHTKQCIKHKASRRVVWKLSGYGSLGRVKELLPVVAVLNLKCSTQAFIDVERCKILNFSTQSTSGLSQNKPFDWLSYQLSNGDMCKFHKASLKITIVCRSTPNKYYYTFKLHFSFLLGQHTPVNSQCLAAVASFPSNTVHYWMELCKKNIIGCWWRHYIKVRENYKITKFCKINCTSLFTATLCLHLSMTIFNV